MPGPNELKERLKQIREAVEARLPDIAAVLSLSAKALAERNIKDKGFGKKYSENRVPAWFLEGKELNQQGPAFLKQKKKQDQKNTYVQDGVTYLPEDYGTNWKEFRQAQGLQTNFVDLSYSNMMWSNMQPVKIEERDGKTFAPLGATNREAQNKMNWNFDRYGDFIGAALTEDDRKLLVEVVQGEVLAVMEQFKL